MESICIGSSNLINIGSSNLNCIESLNLNVHRDTTSSSSSSSVKTNLSSTNPMPKDLDDEAKLARLPSGFKFKPADAILIHYYLAGKNLGEALPANRMKEVLDFYNHHPEKFKQDYKGYEPNHWYLFTRKCYREKSVRGGSTAVRGSVDNTNRVRIRVAGPGFWLSTTARSPIYSSSDSTVLIGRKDTWVYHEVRGRKACRTEYVMLEYTTKTEYENEEKNEKDGWVLCRIDKLRSN